MSDLPEPKHLNPKTIGLVIGLPFCGRPVTPEWAVSFANQNYPLNIRRMNCTMKGEEVGKARNQMIDEALKYKAKYIWFLDDDTAPPFHAVRSLITTMEQADDKVLVVAGVYCAKTLPTEPVLYRGNGYGAFWKWKHGDVFEVSGIGTGCMLIDVQKLKASGIEKPYFRTIDAQGTAEVPTIQVSDDLYFCEKVMEAGYKILCDSNVMCVHWDIETMTPYMLPENSYPIRPVTDKEPRCERALDISSLVGVEG